MVTVIMVVSTVGKNGRKVSKIESKQPEIGSNRPDSAQKQVDFTLFFALVFKIFAHFLQLLLYCQNFEMFWFFVMYLVLGICFLVMNLMWFCLANSVFLYKCCWRLSTECSITA